MFICWILIYPAVCYPTFEQLGLFVYDTLSQGVGKTIGLGGGEGEGERAGSVSRSSYFA